MASANQLFHFSQPTVHTAIKRAIRELGWKIEDESKSKIIVSTPASLESWGETIEITISPKANYTRVSVTSSPNLQIFDWGKSEENIKTMLDTLENLL